MGFSATPPLRPVSRAATPALLRLCNSTDSEIHYQTVRTVEAMGAPAPEVLVVVEALAEDSNSMVQTVAKRLLQSSEAR